MKYCIYCGKQIGDSQKYCPYCGKPQVRKKTEEKEHVSDDDSGAKSGIGKFLPVIVIVVIVVVAVLAVWRTGVLDTILSRFGSDVVEEEQEEDEIDLIDEDDLSAEEEDAEEEEETETDYTLTLDTSSITLTYVGEMERITFSANIEDTSEIIWTSSDESVVTVDENGYVTAVASGDAVVTAEWEELKATCRVICEIEEDEDYIIPDSNSRYLTVSDLEDLTADELRIARNEIYARHGRKFDDEDLQAYFNSKSWYTGTIDPDDFTTALLNEYEFENAEFISEYEKEMGYR